MTIYRFIGDQWTGKTTCALSGKGGSWYGELDAGSWDRAAKGINAKNVEHYAGEMPIDDMLAALLDEGAISTAATGGGAGPIRVIHHLQGYNESLIAFRRAFSKAVVKPEIENIVFDTESDLWKLEQMALTQRIQKETNIKRERLSSLEYEDLHGDMDQLVKIVRLTKKNLILVVRTTDEWGPNPNGSGQAKTGKRIADGWDRAPYRADVELTFSVKNKVPQATISKGGAMGLIGMVITEPTLPKIDALIQSAQAIHDDGGELPNSTEEILVLGKMMGVDVAAG